MVAVIVLARVRTESEATDDFVGNHVNFQKMESVTEALYRCRFQLMKEHYDLNEYPQLIQILDNVRCILSAQARVLKFFAQLHCLEDFSLVQMSKRYEPLRPDESALTLESDESIFEPSWTWTLISPPSMSPNKAIQEVGMGAAFS